MSIARAFGCLVCILLLGSIVEGGVVTVTQTMDYTDNGPWETGPYFMVPGEIEDHPPHYRHMNEDWGWIHNMAPLEPAGALGIQSATLAIEAWDVDYYEPPAEIDRVYANDVLLGILTDTNGRNYGYTYFDLPADVLAELWTDRAVYIYLDIDISRIGERVALRQAKLTVEYLIQGETPEPDPTGEVYRFWSDNLSSHFYTIDEAEKTKLMYDYAGVWTYEGPAYRALLDDTDPDAFPVHRFWSDALGGHFYTINEVEKDKLITDYAGVWTYEGVAFYAYIEGLTPADAIPVYRFWSDALGHHFYTTDEAEKQKLIDTYSYTWTYEGVAWYAFEP